MNPALRRYTLSCAALMFIYSALVALISWGLDLQQLPYALRVLAAASPALPLLAMLYVFDRYLRSEPTNSCASSCPARRCWPAAWWSGCSAPGASSNNTPPGRASR